MQLCAEDYQWWWRSFYRGMSVAIYSAIFSIFFYHSVLPPMYGLSLVLYTCYMLVASTAMNLAMGTIGFLSSAAFVFSIYRSANAAGQPLAPQG
jgi:transmembrane 9 superfamily member 2/4